MTPRPGKPHAPTGGRQTNDRVGWYLAGGCGLAAILAVALLAAALLRALR